jgi:two-component sensor histidine kinase
LLKQRLQAGFGPDAAEDAVESEHEGQYGRWAEEGVLMLQDEQHERKSQQAEADGSPKNPQLPLILVSYVEEAGCGYGHHDRKDVRDEEKVLQKEYAHKNKNRLEVVDKL